MLALPLWKDSDSLNELYISSYNELFINSVGYVFDRNKLYGGLGYRLNEIFRFELGYMKQFLRNGNRDQINLVCLLIGTCPQKVSSIQNDGFYDLVVNLKSIA